MKTLAIVALLIYIVNAFALKEPVRQVVLWIIGGVGLLLWALHCLGVLQLSDCLTT